jgi:hypothetical protein
VKPALVLVAAVFAFGLAACGDGKKQMMNPEPDAGMEPAPDAMPDAPPSQETTFTSYVIDLITNGTSNTAQPRPYSEFQALPDLDLMNGSAYQSLF